MNRDPQIDCLAIVKACAATITMVGTSLAGIALLGLSRRRGKPRLGDWAAFRALKRGETTVGELSQSLAETLEFDETLSRATRLIVPGLADCCLLFLLRGPSRSPWLAAARHRNPDLDGSLAAAAEFFVGENHTGMGLARALEKKNTLVVPDLDSETAASRIEDRETREAFLKLGLGSYIIAPLKARGETRGAIVLATGGSERKFHFCDRSLADELAQRIALAVDNARLFSEAKEAVKVREDMLSIVSHDLKNPITSANLAVQLLLKQISDRPETIPLARTANNIQKALDSMRSLVQNILDIGKIQAGNFCVELESVETGSLFGSFGEMMQTIAQEKRIGLSFELEQGPKSLFCDRSRLQQVLSNVVGNALKFTPAGGKIRVCLRQEGEFHLFSVEDSGPGIPASELPFVFERHWQASASAHGGHGLGLFIARGIVEAHGGKIWVESETGRGCRVLFSLPAGISKEAGERGKSDTLPSSA